MERLQSPWGRFTAYLEAYLADHGLLRKLYRNFYQVSEGVFRSNHPSPRFLRQLQKKHGIKTVVSLRRANKTGQYLFEKQACDELGITLINNHMSSRSLPKNHKIEKLIVVFEAAEKPLLIHCKSGADRAGLASVIYEYAINKKPIEDALKQLHWRFGHFRYADTGKLDFFFLITIWHLIKKTLMWIYWNGCNIIMTAKR